MSSRPKTQFKRESFFNKAEFLVDAQFFQAEFGELTNFNEVKITQKINFSAGIFLKGASFQGIKTWGQDPNLCSRAFFDVQASGSLVLSRIYAAPITRLGCLAFEGQGAFALQS